MMYLFYENNELRAYTNKRKMYKQYKKTRDMSKLSVYIITEKKCSKKFKNLLIENSDKELFYYVGYEAEHETIPITEEDWRIVETSVLTDMTYVVGQIDGILDKIDKLKVNNKKFISNLMSLKELLTDFIEEEEPIFDELVDIDKYLCKVAKR